ncbi:MAG: O-Antigen ligase [candidate division BRC1 bacterium ADurb.BinA364]|nr:MAG: O-Antigen ligase [candidate division BRC1 bacterium ADurb.BinA364]
MISVSASPTVRFADAQSQRRPVWPALVRAQSSVLVSRRQRWILSLLCLALIFRLTIMIRRRDAAEFQTVDRFAALEIMIVGLTGAFLLILPRRREILMRICQTPLAIYMVFCAIGVASAAWSLSPSFSAYRAMQALIESYAIFVILLSLPDYRKAEKWVLSLVWMAILLAVAGDAKLGKLRPSGLSDNTVGAMAVMIACYSFGEWQAAGRDRKRMLFYSFLGGLFFTVFSLSLASWWAFLCGALLACVLCKRSIWIVLMVAALLPCLYVASPQLIDKIVFRDKDAEEISTLHGRTILWQSYWDAYQRRPLLGYGYAIGARASSPIYNTNTHNAFWGIVLNCGAVGLAVFALFICRLLGWIRAKLRRGLAGAIGSAAFLVSGGINSMSLGFIGETWQSATFVFFCFLALACLHDMQSQTARGSRKVVGYIKMVSLAK